jgi:DmsE family decaheme c-type cytochrome
MARRLLALVSLVCVQALMGQEPAKDDYAGMDMCAICHEDVVTALKKGPHWSAYKLMLPSEEARGCESCHGPSAIHASDPTQPVFAFKDEPVGERVARCASCHEGRAGNSFHRGIHELGGQSCDVCHMSGHEAERASTEKLLREAEPGLCFECHFEQKAQMDMPFRHRTSDGVLKCSDCHGVHGRSMKRQQRLARLDACKNCHSDKKGPFMFEHLARTVTGCVSCHQPHGSTNPRLLVRSQMQFLCLECHPETTRYHDVSQARFQNCTVCHVAIHGSHLDAMFLK